MHADTLDLLRCPYCGGSLELKKDLYHRCTGDDILDGVLGCHCCHFAIVAGIAVATLSGQADTAREQVEQGQPDLAALTMMGVEDPAIAAALSAPSATYQDVVEVLGTSFEGGYFLYRFSDPTFVVADAVVRAVAPRVLGAGGRAVDLCGGSGHLTRTLGELSGEPPVLMDLSFVKLWLARRFTAPGCEAVCADAHAPLPFASSAFRLAVCNDAFHYIWTKALFAREMARVTADEGIAAITHVHNADQWNPSAGNPLPPRGYRALFERPAARVFGERALLADVIDGHLNLVRCDSDATLSADPSLTVIASGREDAFSDTPLESRRPVRGRLMLNPLYAVTFEERRARLQLQFPSKDYEDEYSASRRYLPDHLVIDRTTLAQIESGISSTEIDALRERRVVLDLPPRYL